MLCISYKADYTNSCRGCEMERYGSDFQMHHFATVEEVIEHCSRLNANTHFNQICGENAWDHRIIEDGFETRIKNLQYEEGEILQSQGSAECFFTFEYDIEEKIKLRTAEIYNALISDKKAKEKAERDEKERRNLQSEIARAKKLLMEHPEKF